MSDDGASGSTAPEQMLLLRMVDMVVAEPSSPATTDYGPDAALVEFFCTEFTALHAPPVTSEPDEDAAPSSDRQAMWDVMEIESSKRMFHILGTLTSTPATLDDAKVLPFIAALVGQLRRFTTTHTRVTNAAALSSEPVDEAFGYRSAGVRVLGSMAHRSTSVQEALRACGGLEILLNR
ncbi:hypothetical protein DYB32_010084 [Aphanomyces invadans]|uniref:Ataxin-10 domain-containing protein n=1 Tax=Aphanomyces invadans TaxID=157072 RepID=A0A418AGS0_9STRA|nr:hypothetical protein DYB32_010084 [Aphanomyces invadans]